MHAHGGGVLKVGSYYYWFGENRNAEQHLPRGLGLPLHRPAELGVPQQRADPVVGTPSSTSANIERPKVIYNARTGKYVMWMHKENGTDYSEARAAVASSATVDGDYTYHGSFRPLGSTCPATSRSTTTTAPAYMISAADENYDLHIYRLTAGLPRHRHAGRQLLERRPPRGAGACSSGAASTSC